MGEIRQHRIKSDYGIADYYKHYRNSGGTQDRKTYTKTVRRFFELVGDVIINNEYSYKIFGRLGIITVKKIKTYIKFKEGKLKTNLPINYKETNLLWKNNPEAKKNKKYVYYENKHSNGFKYKFCYLKYTANYANKSLYNLKINRQLKRKLADLIYTAGEIERGLKNVI